MALSPHLHSHRHLKPRSPKVTWYLEHPREAAAFLGYRLFLDFFLLGQKHCRTAPSIATGNLLLFSTVCLKLFS